MEDIREEVHRVGHRQFVGGRDEFWDRIGTLQFEFLVARGLTPTDTFVDVACGSLRGGARFIRYLDADRYLGIEKHIELVIYGVAQELGIETFRDKQPAFVISDTFEFHKFGRRPTFGIAQSLFTHLSADDIGACLSRLRAVAAPGCRFFATFFEAGAPMNNPPVSHSHQYFGYTRAQMEAFGVQSGWAPHYIGAWNHPREQRMIEYVAR